MKTEHFLMVVMLIDIFLCLWVVFRDIRADISRKEAREFISSWNKHIERHDMAVENIAREVEYFIKENKKE